MKIKYLFSGLILFVSLIAVPSAIAGGGLIEPVSIQGPNGASFANPGEAFTVTFRAHLDSVTYPVPADLCKQCPIKVEFFDPRNGDIVNPTSDRTNDEGEITAKVASVAPYIRYIRATVTLPNGTVYKGSPLMLNFTGKNLVYPESNNPIYALPTLTPFPDSNEVNINAWVLSQQIINNSNRTVTIKWGAFDGNSGTFTIYGKPASKNDWDKLLDGQKGPSAMVTIKTDEDYSIKVYGCQDKIGTCADSNTILLPKLQNVVSSQNPNPTVIYVTNNNDQKVNDLNKKVNDLQNQLDQSQKKQSFLEQRLNDLITFLKRIFPFFKN